MSHLYHVDSNFDCASEFLEASTHCRYISDDGRTFPLDHHLAWCFECDFVTSAEKLTSEKVLLGQMVRLALGTLPDSQVEAIVCDPQKLERILRLRSRELNAQTSLREWDLLELEMIRTRRSPPRCLTCGSTSLLLPTSPPETIEFDLKDGRWVKLRGSGIAEDCIDPHPTYSWEGLRVIRPEVL